MPPPLKRTRDFGWRRLTEPAAGMVATERLPLLVGPGVGEQTARQQGKRRSGRSYGRALAVVLGVMMIAAGSFSRRRAATSAAGSPQTVLAGEPAAAVMLGDEQDGTTLAPGDLFWLTGGKKSHQNTRLKTEDRPAKCEATPQLLPRLAVDGVFASCRVGRLAEMGRSSESERGSAGPRFSSPCNPLPSCERARPPRRVSLCVALM